jgi:hypothetical protein
MLTLIRHPEVRAKRANQVGYNRLGQVKFEIGKSRFRWGDGPGIRAASFEGRFAATSG